MTTKLELEVEIEKCLAKINDQNVEEMIENIENLIPEFEPERILSILVRIIPLQSKFIESIDAIFSALIKIPRFASLKSLLLKKALYSNSDNGRFLDNRFYLVILRKCFLNGLYKIDEILPEIKKIDSQHNGYKAYIGIFFLKEIYENDKELFEVIKTARKDPGYIFQASTHNLPSCDELVENDYKLLNNLLTYGHHEPIVVSIIKDDVDMFIKLYTLDQNASKKKFDASIFSSNFLFKDLTMFNIAARNGSIQIFKYLYVNKAEFDRETFNSAIIGGNLEIIRICIQNNCSGVECVTTAAVYRPYDILEWLLENYVSEENRLKELEKAYYEAVRSNCLYSVVYCIQNGVDVNSKNNNNYSHPLFAAIQYPAIIEYLLSQPDIDANKSNYSGTPFALACAIGYEETVRIMMKSDKVDITLHETTNESALGSAIVSGRLNIVKLLLDSGKFDINEQNYRGETPLYLAVSENRPDVAEYLLSKGANTEIQSNQEYTAIQLAKLRNDNAMVELLLKYNAKDLPKPEPRSYV